MVLVYAMSIIAMNFVISELVALRFCVGIYASSAAHNFFFQLAVPAFILARPGERSKLWGVVGGDSGIIVAALYAVTFLSFLLPRLRHVDHFS